MIKNTYTIAVDLNNDAFRRGNARAELVRILRDEAHRLEQIGGPLDSRGHRAVTDSNANVVGTIILE